MKEKQYVTDTHSLVWYFSENLNRISKKALKVFDRTVKEGTIIIPTVVLAEIMYISKKGRIPITFAETLERIEKNENFEIIPLDIDILKSANDIDCDLEMHDKLIVATAIFFNAPLITKDQEIKKSGLCSVIW